MTSVVIVMDKRFLTCSVENLNNHQDAQVVGQDQQIHFPALRPIRARTEISTAVALEHAVDRFGLPADSAISRPFPSAKCTGRGPVN